MGDVEQLRFAQLLKRLFGTRARDPGRNLSPLVAPTTDLQDFYQPENRANRGEKLFTVFATLTNLAATNFGVALLTNPVASGRIGVVKRVTWSGIAPTTTTQPGVTFLAISDPLALGAFGVPGVLKDSRYGVGAQGTLGFGSATTSVQPLNINSTYKVQFLLGAATTSFFHQVDNLDIVLSQGFHFNFHFTSDTLPAVTYTWNIQVEGYERTIDPNELNPVA